MNERELLLRLNRGPISGDVLARESGLTRAAMWKRIEALRDAGIEIDAQAGRGYVLKQAIELLDESLITSRVPPTVRDLLASLEVAWSMGSTNSELLRRETPTSGAAALLAERQTAGRGRRGRVWASPLAAHLYLSVARYFSGGLARLGGLSLVAGIATAEALHTLGFAAVQLKWPNDLLVENRKLGGILVEGGGEHAGPARAVIGIGLNVRMPEAFANKIDQAWCDLQALSHLQVSRNNVAAAVLSALLPALEQFDAEGLAPFLPRYAALDALLGCEVNVMSGEITHAGVASGLANDGGLRVKLVDGSERIFHAGEVSVRARHSGESRVFNSGAGNPVT